MKPPPALPPPPGSPPLDQALVKALRQKLVAWYRANRRDLPWRRRGDAYAIWVSEIMLQQTQVETVKPYFRRFMERFPDVSALANSDEQEVLSHWSGLGYYARARNLRRGAQAVLNDHGGVLPESAPELRTIPGIGPYTAGAISSIAYGRPEGILDGNVARVLSRVFVLEGDPKSTPGKKVLWYLAHALVDEEDPSSFNQGLMELGAMVCTPTSPACPSCPLKELCLGRARGRQGELPIKSPKKARPHVDLMALIIEGPEGYLLARRPPKGLLGGLWEFPLVSVDGGQALEGDAPKRMSTRALGTLPPWVGPPEPLVFQGASRWRAGVEVRVVEGPKGRLEPVSHLFTHLSARVFGVRGRVIGGGVGVDPQPPERVGGILVDYEAMEWVMPKELGAYPKGKIMVELLRALEEAGGQLLPS